MSILQLKNDIEEFVMKNVKRKITEILKNKLKNPIENAELVPNFENFLKNNFNGDFIKDAKAAYITTDEIEALLASPSRGGRAKKKTRKRKLSRPRRATLGKNKGGEKKKVRAFRMSGGGIDDIVQAYPVEGTQLKTINSSQYPNYSLREYEYIIKQSNEFIKRQEENMKKFKEKLLKKAKEPLKNLLMCVLEEHFASVLTREFKADLNNAVNISEPQASGAVKDAANNVKLYQAVWNEKKRVSEESEDKCINESLQNIVDEYNRISNQNTPITSLYT